MSESRNTHTLTFHTHTDIPKIATPHIDRDKSLSFFFSSFVVVVVVLLFLIVLTLFRHRFMLLPGTRHSLEA